MKKFLRILISVLVVLIIGFIYYYFALPAINIHSKGLWTFLIIGVIFITAVIGLITADQEKTKIKNRFVFHNKFFKIFAGISGIVIIIFIAGYVLSSPIVNSGKYQRLLTIEEADFTEDIKQISYNKIPILDKDSANRLGSRKMGSIIEYVSQFEVANNYTQINFQNKPVRVTPLAYGSLFKWFTNQSQGIPAYIMIDMTTQEVELVELENRIKYSESDHFGRNIYRHLRFNYPTYIFDTINFEINDEGIPYWICPVKDYTIGLFGGEVIRRVVAVNAITGEHEDYAVENVPQWIDRVFSAELLINLYDYHGTLKHGYLNSIFAQRDSLQTTDGYNYIALDDDVWVYTGVTSVGGDESNVGFVLMNQRTSETHYYSIAGAEEYSAMDSAEGKVQHLGYRATFPLLLNINGEPTYFIALKDAAGLVKSYAMVNIKQYQIVAIGDSVSECEESYLKLLKSNNINIVDTTTLPKVTGTIEKISEVVVDGNTHYYIILKNKKDVFDITVSDFIEIVTYNIDDTITFYYTEGENINTVLNIE